MTRIPVPDWVSWSELAAVLKKSQRQIKRDAKARGLRVFCMGQHSKGVLTIDVPRLYHIRREGL